MFVTWSGVRGLKQFHENLSKTSSDPAKESCKLCLLTSPPGWRGKNGPRAPFSQSGPAWAKSNKHLWLCGSVFVGTLHKRHCAVTVQVERFCCTMLMHLSGYLNEEVKKEEVSPAPPRPVAGKVHHNACSSNTFSQRRTQTQRENTCQNRGFGVGIAVRSLTFPPLAVCGSCLQYAQARTRVAKVPMRLFFYSERKKCG